jgi:four helix bundle protein
VYQASLDFVKWLTPLLVELPKGSAVLAQLDRASTSIPLNIAEGNGRFTAADRCRFFDMARGSALECAAALDVLVARDLANAQRMVDGKEILSQIVSMLFGLIRSNSSARAHELPNAYGAGDEQE